MAKRKIVRAMLPLLLCAGIPDVWAQNTSPAPPPQRTPLTQTTNAPAQGKLAGNWQGRLETGKGDGLRIVVKIAGDDGKYHGALYSIDQGPGSNALSAVALEGPSVTFTIKSLDLTYNGTLNPDGNTISGSSTQGKETHSLNLKRVSEEDTWAIPETPKPMPVDAQPKFDVLTVKPSDPKESGKLFTTRGRHEMTYNTSVSDLITFAYGLHARQLIGGPDWLDEKYDLDGVPDVEGEPSLKQTKMLIQDALATRFGLRFHHEQRELSAYVLTVAKGGEKMTVTAEGVSGSGNFLLGGFGRLHVTNSTMKDFCEGMQAWVMDKPVVDHTGLTDRYDFNLNWTPDEGQFAAFGGYRAPPQEKPDAPPSIYTAIQEQIGLKLEATKTMVDTFVIDQIEKPGAN